MNEFFKTNTLEIKHTRCNSTGKISHSSYREAADALQKLRHTAFRKDWMGRRIKHGSPKPGGKRIYYCAFCGGYHLTSWSWWHTATKRHITNQQHKIIIRQTGISQSF